MPTVLHTAEFNQAMDEYMAVSKKDRATVANAKLRDWMFKSMKAMPKADRQEILDVIESPKLVSWYTTRLFGGKGWDRDDQAEAKKRLRKRLSAVSWGKSGWSKAANKLPDTKEPRPGKQRQPVGGKRLTRFKGTSALIRKARKAEKNLASADISWQTAASSAKLAGISDRALRSGQLLMVQDTRRYIERKLAKIGRKVSA